MLFNGPLLAEIEHEYFPCLPDAVYTADPLFQAHWAPGQIEIDYGIGELQVAALTAAAGGEQHSRIVPEPGDGGVFLRP